MHLIDCVTVRFARVFPANTMMEKLKDLKAATAFVSLKKKSVEKKSQLYCEL